MNSIHPQLLLLQQITGQHCNSSVSLDSCLSGGMLPLKEETHISDSQIRCRITHLCPLIDGIWELFVLLLFLCVNCFTIHNQHPNQLSHSRLQKVPRVMPNQSCSQNWLGKSSRPPLSSKWVSTIHQKFPLMHLLMCSASCAHECPSKGRFGGKRWQDCFAFRKARKWLFFCRKSCKIIFGLFSKVKKKQLKMSQLHFHAFNSQPTPSLSTVNEINAIEHQNNASHHITNCGTTFSFLFSNNAQITSNSAPSPSQPRLRCVDDHFNLNVSQILLVQGLHGLFRSWIVLFQFSPNSSSPRNEAPGSQHKVNPEGHISGMKGEVREWRGRWRVGGIKERGEAVRRWMNAAWSWALEIVGFKRVAHQESSIMRTISVPQRSSLAPLSSSVSSRAILELLAEINPDNCLSKLGQFYTFLAFTFVLLPFLPSHLVIQIRSTPFPGSIPFVYSIVPLISLSLPFNGLISLTNSTSLHHLHFPSQIAPYNEDPNILSLSW